jgi:ElaB/YqjD/DUF883 family membrane-anchored ribosome-binding protein
MPKSKHAYPEIDDIKEDLNSLRQNVVELTKHIGKDGKIQTEELKSKAFGTYKDFKSSARAQLKDLEGHVREKPGQSIAIAFAAGIVASLLMGRR